MNKTKKPSSRDACSVDVDAVVRRNWTDEYNALPIEIRTIANAVGMADQINCLKREKLRLVRRYKQSIREINDKIEYIKTRLDGYA